MPILNTRIQAEARDQQGKPISIPLNMALQQAGPRVQITQLRYLLTRGQLLGMADPFLAQQVILSDLQAEIATKRAYGASLASQGLIVLIGRDMLANCVLVYNGPDSSFSLSL